VTHPRLPDRIVLCGLPLLIASLTVGTAAEPPTGGGTAYRVKSGGEMRNVMQKGNLDAHVDCGTLRGLRGLYALGPVEGLKGEITVLDGKPSVSTVRDGKPAVSDEWPKACFLVYVQVEGWQTTALPKDVVTLAHLQPVVLSAAKKAGLDVEKPFPFRLTGTPKRVDYHIVWKTDGLPHTRELHAKAKRPFVVEGREVEMLGFYSDKHHGVFTHHDSNIHVHVRTADGKDSGHVDAVTLASGMTLHLPKP
jgi:acetolactate decarboxylase